MTIHLGRSNPSQAPNQPPSQPPSQPPNQPPRQPPRQPPSQPLQPPTETTDVMPHVTHTMQPIDRNIGREMRHTLRQAFLDDVATRAHLDGNQN